MPGPGKTQCEVCCHGPVEKCTHKECYVQELCERIKRLFEPANCPHCGTYCTGKTVFCTPPIERKETDNGR